MAPPVVVLVETQLPENLGAAARAMANFGLRELRLVAPAVPPDHPQAVAVAASGAPVLAAARVYDDLPAALADLHRVWATAALERAFEKPPLHPRALAPVLRGAAAAGQGCGVVFGPERTGLRYEDLALAEGLVRIPTDPGCRALNLAQAVAVVAWEWSAAEAEAVPAGPTPAPRAELQGLFDHLEAALDAAGFLSNPHLRVRTVRNLRTALIRAGLTTQEIRTLRGAVGALARTRER